MSNQSPAVSVVFGNQATNCNIIFQAAAPTSPASPIKTRQTRKRKIEENTPAKKVTAKKAKATPVKKAGHKGAAATATKNRKPPAPKAPKAAAKAPKKETPVRRAGKKKENAQMDASPKKATTKGAKAKVAATQGGTAKEPKPKATKKPAPKKTKSPPSRQPRKRKIQENDDQQDSTSNAQLNQHGRIDAIPATSTSAVNSQVCDEQPEEKDICPICYDTPNHPFKLPCGHEFCFVCAKGLSETNLSSTGICPMCRQSFSGDIFKHPQMLPQNQEAEKNCVQGATWYYEGNNGWWKFDARNNEEIESAFASGNEKAQMLLCGNMYMIDFKNMVQYRRDGLGRVRRIKRESGPNASSMYVKGVAGLVYNQ